jgi:hypothetical protein
VTSEDVASVCVGGALAIGSWPPAHARVGLAGVTAVPPIVVVHHLIVGYIDDEHTGRDIVETIAGCRKVDAATPARDYRRCRHFRRRLASQYAGTVRLSPAALVLPNRGMCQPVTETKMDRAVEISIEAGPAGHAYHC